MKTLFSAIIFSLLANMATAQTQFITKGKIEFEKKVNMHKGLGDNVWEEEMKRKLPEFATTYFDLRFDEHQSTYKAGKEVDNPWKNGFFGGGEGEDDLIYNNYDSARTIAQKQVFEKLYRVDDSLQQIDWRITSDTRTIAGFECHKAIGRMYDSLYVVAFYTDQIITPGGPGNFTGLPGMILGIGFPRFNTTLFATKVELVEPTVKELAIPTKGKKTNRKDMMDQVKKVFSDQSGNNDWQKYFWQRVL